MSKTGELFDESSINSIKNIKICLPYLCFLYKLLVAKEFQLVIKEGKAHYPCFLVFSFLCFHLKFLTSKVIHLFQRRNESTRMLGSLYLEVRFSNPWRKQSIHIS